MKKLLSLVICALMLMTSAHAATKMIGYRSIRSEDHIYYFEGIEKPIGLGDTVYLTVSNIRSIIIDEKHETWNDMVAQEEMTLTIVTPLDRLEIISHGKEGSKTVFDEKNVAAGNTYTFKDKGTYELCCNYKSLGIVDIVPTDDYAIQTIDNEQLVRDNISHYIPIYSDEEAPHVAQQGAVIANPTNSDIVIEDSAWLLDAYNINGNNYFKLRDLAFAFTYAAVNHPFDVSWDASKNAINLLYNKEYTAVGGECGGWDAEKGDWSDAYWDAIANDTKEVRTAKEALPTSSQIYIDGVKAELTAYNINGNNYFKLRDLAQALDFEVKWDPVENKISVSTNASYIPE